MTNSIKNIFTVFLEYEIELLQLTVSLMFVFWLNRQLHLFYRLSILFFFFYFSVCRWASNKVIKTWQINWIKINVLVVLLAQPRTNNALRLAPTSILIINLHEKFRYRCSTMECIVYERQRRRRVLEHKIFFQKSFKWNQDELSGVINDNTENHIKHYRKVGILNTLRSKNEWEDQLCT